jgi:NAD(P)-dependent dehydrogenase (short-subunit alcohol dehydrogenase family)
MGRLDGKVTVITGGAGEIGSSAGKLFVEEGSKVLLVDMEKDVLEKAVQSIGSDAVSYPVQRS